MNPKKEVRLASGPQCATLAQMVALELTKTFEGKLTFDQAQVSITDREQLDVKKLAEKFCEEIFGIKADPWTEEKKRIETFYRKFFNREIDWSKVSLPEKIVGMNRLEYVFADISENALFEAYAKKFGKDNVWKYYSSITQAIKSQQARPTGDYAVCHVGGDEPDMLGLSYDDGVEKEIKFMIPKEGILAAFRYRAETGKMYDVKGLTRFSALDSDGGAMCMCRGDGGFYVGGGSRGSRYPHYGLRQVSF